MDWMQYRLVKKKKLKSYQFISRLLRKKFKRKKSHIQTKLECKLNE